MLNNNNNNNALKGKNVKIRCFYLEKYKTNLRLHLLISSFIPTNIENKIIKTVDFNIGYLTWLARKPIYT